MLQSVAERIVARHLVVAGHANVQVLAEHPAAQQWQGVDISYTENGARVKLKVKPDAYFGSDPTKVYDRTLTFYRADAGHYAFEAISNAATGTPGWVVESDAEYLYYYYLVLSQSEDEITALMGEPDGIFFSELRVDRDELRVLPMAGVAQWFALNYEAYTPRPVAVAGHSAWYRLVPRMDIDTAVAGIKMVGPVFHATAL